MRANLNELESDHDPIVGRMSDRYNVKKLIKIDIVAERSELLVVKEEN